jgi:hypothetical protein
VSNFPPKTFISVSNASRTSVGASWTAFIILIAASSVRVKGFSVWFVFIIVTLIQFIGNIFFCYTEIDETSQNFKDWSELSAPLFEMLGTEALTVPSQKRWLAILEGGLLPLISLTCLHFFIKYGDIAPIESTAVLNNHDESDKISEVDLVDEADVAESNDIVSEEINHIQEEAVELVEAACADQLG